MFNTDLCILLKQCASAILRIFQAYGFTGMTFNERESNHKATKKAN